MSIEAKLSFQKQLFSENKAGDAFSFGIEEIEPGFATPLRLKEISFSPGAVLRDQLEILAGMARERVGSQGFSLDFDLTDFRKSESNPLYPLRVRTVFKPLQTSWQAARIKIDRIGRQIKRLANKLDDEEKNRGQKRNSAVIASLKRQIGAGEEKVLKLMGWDGEFHFWQEDNLSPLDNLTPVDKRARRETRLDAATGYKNETEESQRQKNLVPFANAAVAGLTILSLGPFVSPLVQATAPAASPAEIKKGMDSSDYLIDPASVSVHVLARPLKKETRQEAVSEEPSSYDQAYGTGALDEKPGEIQPRKPELKQQLNQEEIPVTDVIYQIQPGDTLSGIAKQYGITVEKIVERNKEITDPNFIRSGATIVIPGATVENLEKLGVRGGEGRPIVPLQEEYKIQNKEQWEIFKTFHPDQSYEFYLRAEGVIEGSPGKDQEIVYYNNLWSLNLKAPDNVAYILYHYDNCYMTLEMLNFIKRVIPGFKAGNALLEDKLGDKVSQLPEKPQAILDSVVFAMPDQSPGGGGWSWGEENTGNLAVVYLAPFPSTLGKAMEEEWLAVASQNISHELFHNLIQDEEPFTDVSHLCMSAYTSVVNLANETDSGISGDLLLIMWRLKEAGNSDPLSLILDVAVHPDKSGVLIKAYEQNKQAKDPSIEELIKDPHDIVPPPEAYDYFFEQTEKYLP